MKALVKWEIDVESAEGTVLDCARQAFEAVSAPDSIATVFQVFPEGGTPKQVDLTCGIIEDHIPRCSLALADLDDKGWTHLGRQVHVELSSPSVSDIVSHALQLVLLERRFGFEHHDTQICLGELQEALAVAGILKTPAKA